MVIDLSTSGLPQNGVRLAEILKDYDDTLELAWIPPENRSGFDGAPFAVIQRHPDFEPYIVMSLKESELDHRVLAALFSARVDQNDVLGRLEKEEAAKQIWKEKEREEMREAREDFIKWAVKDVGHDRWHNGRRYT